MFAVEVSYEQDQFGKRSKCFQREDPEVAIQIYVEEAGLAPSRCAELLEPLASGEKLEASGSNGKRIVARELVEAVA